MNSPTILGLALTVIAVGGFVLARSQQRELAGFRSGRISEPAEHRVAPDSTDASAPMAAGGAESGAAPPEAAARVELMALRAKVTELQQRQRELAGVSNENLRLRSSLAGVSNLVARGLPAGFTRLDDARNRGQATPEAALETFLWSTKSRDSNVFLALMPPPAREFMARQIGEQGADAFFREQGKAPGFRIVGRAENGTDDVELKVEVAPGVIAPMKFHRNTGSWTLSE